MFSTLRGESRRSRQAPKGRGVLRSQFLTHPLRHRPCGPVPPPLEGEEQIDRFLYAYPPGRTLS